MFKMFKTRALRKIINLCVVHFDDKNGDGKCLWMSVKCCGFLPKIKSKSCIERFCRKAIQLCPEETLM